MKVYYAPSFFKQLAKLEHDLREEAFIALEQIQNLENHKLLKVHSLHGRMKGLHSFSVNYAYRIIFEYVDKKDIYILKIGKHDIYK